MPFFDVIIATYNNLNELKQCLSGFNKQTFRDFNVFVCVDGSTDGTQAWLNGSVFSFPLQILVHEKDAHRGRNATRNLAMPYLSAAYLVTFDSDMTPDPGLLRAHRDELNVLDCVSLGAIEYLNRETNFWADYIQSRGKNKYRHGDDLPPYYITTGNMAMPSRHFIEIGGQDPNMIAYGGGDTEFAYRLHQTFELPVIYNAYAVGTSHMNKDWPRALNQMEEFGYRNLPYIRRKHPHFNALFRVDRLESMTISGRFFRSLLSDRLYRLVKGWVNAAPASVRRKLMHYLVFCRIAAGYKKHHTEQELIAIVS